MCHQRDSALIVTAAGAVRRVDQCLRAVVQLLNDNRILTFDSCCGHGERWGHITIRAGDVDAVRRLGFRVCEDIGVSQPQYPFVGKIDGQVNIFLPPVLMEDDRAAS